MLSAGLASGLPSAHAAEPSLTDEVVISGLEFPWDMAFLADGTMFFTEKCRGLSVRMPSGEVNALLGMTDTEGFAVPADDLFCDGQAGMMGVAVDPDFDENRRVYVYSTSNMSTPHTNRLMRLVVSDDFTSVSDRTDIVEDVPYKMAPTNHPFGGSGAHNGGRVRFNPADGYLCLTTGDTHAGHVPQSPVLLGGKVLRIDTDGNAAPDNGAPGGFDPRIYTYGHRNVQGIAFRPSDGRPFTAEHGPWHTDEVTALVPGGNAGWDPRPHVGGRGACPDDYCGYMPNQMGEMDPVLRSAFMPMTDTATYPDAMPPAWTNNGRSQGTSSAVFLDGEQWGDWNGLMAVGYLGIGFAGTPVGERIDLFNFTEDGLSVTEVKPMPLPIAAGRVRSVEQGPDGALYVAIDEGDILRFAPE
jgi:glucose/arabinose dehydrogenase